MMMIMPSIIARVSGTGSAGKPVSTLTALVPFVSGKVSATFGPKNPWNRPGSKPNLDHSLTGTRAARSDCIVHPSRPYKEKTRPDIKVGFRGGRCDSNTWGKQLRRLNQLIMQVFPMRCEHSQCEPCDKACHVRSKPAPRPGRIHLKAALRRA